MKIKALYVGLCKKPIESLLADAVVLLVIAATSFLCLAGYPLLDNNEGVYAKIALEMAKGDSWIIPHLNGVFYIEKPPLFYWLIAISFKIFGINTCSARLIPSFAFFINAIFLWNFLAKNISHDVGRFAAFIFSTCIGSIVSARMVFFDGLLSLFLTISIAFFWEWVNQQKEKYIIKSYFFLALAILTKGPVAALLFLLITICFAAQSRTSYKVFFNKKAIYVFILILLPWHVIASIQHDNFFNFYFINEHLLRFLGMRIPKDYYSGPFWYYIPRLLIGVMPWSFYLVLLFKKPVNKFENFLLCWITLPFIFFSLSQAKANYYLIVILPAIAAILGIQILKIIEKTKIQLVMRATAGILIGMHFWTDRSLLIPLVVFLADPILIRNKTWKKTGISLSVICLWIMLIIKVINSNELNNYSSESLAKTVSANESTVYFYKHYESFSAFPFYYDKNVSVVNSKSNDLMYGFKTNKTNSLTVNEFEHAISNKPIFLLVTEKDLPEVTKLFNNKLHIVLKTKRVVLMKN